MCLIIFTPDISTAIIRKSVLLRGFDGNDDGCGFSYLENGKVKLQKGYFTFDGFYKAYKNARKRIKTGPFLIHFRASTRGILNKTNSQPIFVNENFVMAHNGTFHDLKIWNKKFSDSVTMAKSLADMNISLPFNRGWRSILNTLCEGFVNKLVFFDSAGNWDIINRRLGMWRNGCWYSDKGECLKREIYPGYYRSKEWKQFQTFGRQKKAKKEKKVKTVKWVYEGGVAVPVDVKVKQTKILQPHRFGGPSKIMRPTVFAEPFYKFPGMAGFDANSI